MAEEFVIRVQVENLQGRSAAPRTGSNSQQNTGNRFEEVAEEQQRRITTYNPIKGADNSFDERYTKRGIGPTGIIGSMGISEYKDSYLRNLGLERFGTVRRVQVTNPGMLTQERSFTQETMFGAGVRHSSKFVMENRARVRASLNIAVNSTVRGLIAVKNHRSGDSYRNEKRQLYQSATSSIASIGIAGAIWGPGAAAAFAFNAGVSTATNIITENVNFKYDRMMDTLYIHNIKQVAGDISYGRNRRGGN